MQRRPGRKPCDDERAGRGECRRLGPIRQLKSHQLEPRPPPARIVTFPPGACSIEFSADPAIAIGIPYPGHPEEQKVPGLSLIHWLGYWRGHVGNSVSTSVASGIVDAKVRSASGSNAPGSSAWKCNDECQMRTSDGREEKGDRRG